jgi:hypothetical protein
MTELAEFGHLWGLGILLCEVGFVREKAVRV